MDTVMSITPTPPDTRTHQCTQRIWRRRARVLLLGLAFGMTHSSLIWAEALAPTPADPGYQSIQSIRSTIVSYISAQLPSDGNERSIEPGRLDPRLRLQQCDQPLEAFLPHGATMRASLSVGVRCTGTKPWRIYVSTRIATRGNVLVAAGALPRGTVLAAHHLRLEPRDLGAIHHGYIANKEHALGHALRRNVAPNAVITPAMLAQQHLVRRGQSVTLETRVSGLHIRMAGLALADGQAGARIKVKNVSSQRIVEGIVRNKEVVEIIYK